MATSLRIDYFHSNNNFDIHSFQHPTSAAPPVGQQLIPPLLPHGLKLPSPSELVKFSPLTGPAVGGIGNPVLDSSSEYQAQGGGGPSGSRPGSAHSAPMLDLSIDRHYEFDAARTPTDDLLQGW